MDLFVMLAAYFAITALIMLFAYSFTLLCLWLMHSERIRKHSWIILIISVLIICTAVLFVLPA
jgi:hypothetical protein